MQVVTVSTVSTPEGDTWVVRWVTRGTTGAPVDLIVWPGGGFVRTLAAFRLAKTRQTLHIFEAAIA